MIQKYTDKIVDVSKLSLFKRKLTDLSTMWRTGLILKWRSGDTLLRLRHCQCVGGGRSSSGRNVDVYQQYTSTGTTTRSSLLQIKATRMASASKSACQHQQPTPAEMISNPRCFDAIQLSAQARTNKSTTRLFLNL
jgi:hypothetical protein